MLEMVVADDLRPNGSASAAPSKRLVPAPHTASPGLPASGDLSAAAVAAAAAAESLNGRRASLNGAGGSLLPPAAVQQLLAQQATSKAMGSQLSLAQRTIKEQTMELQEVRQELS
jgi:hypothetical protein